MGARKRSSWQSPREPDPDKGCRPTRAKKDRKISDPPHPQALAEKADPKVANRGGTRSTSSSRSNGGVASKHFLLAWLGSMAPDLKYIGDELQGAPRWRCQTAPSGWMEFLGPSLTFMTLNRTAEPQVSMVSISLEGGGSSEPICRATRRSATSNAHQSPFSIKGDGLFEDMGLRGCLVIFGKARITEGGAAELLNRLAQTYFGEGSDFPPMPDPPPGYVTRIEVERIAGIGPWAG